MSENLRDEWDNISYDDRLAAAAYIFEQLILHSKGDGSYRTLIYNRLGFEEDAYVPLYRAGGMEISNEFVITRPEPSDNDMHNTVISLLNDAKIPVGKLRETIVDCAYRVAELSAALKAEQERRSRIEMECAALAKGLT